MSTTFLNFQDAAITIDLAIREGKSIIETVQSNTGITTQHLALLADTLLQKLRHTTYELMKIKQSTGSTRQAVDRSLSKSLVLFLYELKKAGGIAHYNDIRTIVKDKYNMMSNDYTTLSYYQMIKKSKGLGMWQLTEIGEKFLKNEIQLPERLKIQNNKVISSSDTLVSINDFISLEKNSVSDALIEKRKDGLSKYLDDTVAYPFYRREKGWF